MRILAIALVAAFICGCSTKYQEMGFTGGVHAQQMTSDTFRISARGNGFTSKNDVQDYMLLKAAETTKSVGGTHFVIISETDVSRTDSIITQGSAQTSVIGNTLYTTYEPPTVHEFYKPGQDAYIRVISVPLGETPPAGAVPADEIIQFVGSRVARG
jgi:hypothetical protein